jgi:dTDP-4-dehydrorhamnose 3,5-epimerase
MKLIPTSLPDVMIVAPTVFEDDRGFFLESYNKRVLAGHGIRGEFVQDNHSRSIRDVLRGLHYQIGQPQGKLVRVIAGEIFDVAVDIRRSSAYFGQWVGVRLSDENRHLLWVPEGFAHGYLVLSDCAEVLYKATDYYAPREERAIIWNDADLGIDWPISGAPILSEKDAVASAFSHAQLFD